ncbi:hypothetical protein [Haladaptatus sp. CMAA 1911]|uniref:hypothetical protein n=1 Tax=unclassified Haladaptatus TaxID=2622732 RepID=UPI0037545B0D
MGDEEWIESPIPYGEEPMAFDKNYDGIDMSSDVCGGCGVKKGEIHHGGCSYECCPNCGGLYTFCDCCSRLDMYEKDNGEEIPYEPQYNMIPIKPWELPD